MSEGKQFHVLYAPLSERLIGDASARIEKWKPIPCPDTNEHFDGHRVRDDSPLTLEVMHNRHDELIIWSLFECVVHIQLLEEMRREGFSGYIVKPALVQFQDGHVSSDYAELIVTGWAGMALPASGIHLEKSCSKCGWTRYSGFMDTENVVNWSQWTGDDFFILWPMPKYRLVSSRVGEWLKRQKIKSFRLLNFSDFDPFLNRFGFRPGKLSNYLPSDLAERYGKQLGLDIRQYRI